MRLLSVLAGLAALAAGQYDVGQNAPDGFTRLLFVQAYYRNLFYTMVYTPPLTDVRRLGANGLYQEFQDAARTGGVRYGLVKADANTSDDVRQVLAPLYNYYIGMAGSPGVATVGYPVADSLSCPPYFDALCHYVFTDKNYALFAYTKNISVFVGSTFYIREPFYTKWTNLGGIAGLGAPLSPEQAVSSSFSSINATRQLYQEGATFNITSGALNGRLVSIQQPVYDFWVAQGGFAALGYPLTDVQLTPAGKQRQNFEGGAIEYGADRIPYLLAPVKSLTLRGVSNPLKLELGQTKAVQAVAYDAAGQELPDRTVTWVTSNGQVAAIDANGYAATIRATGGGTATIRALSEGKSSAAITVQVFAPCCVAGEGAPTPALQQAIVDLLSRYRLPVKLPTPYPVRREGGGYVQEFASTVDPGARYLAAIPDGLATAYYLSGALLARYEALGGFTGALGYPFSDPTAAGRQLFRNNAALAGSPVRLVTGAIFSRWAAGGYETGALGSPAAEAAPFQTFTASTGSLQAFQGGALADLTSGPLAGKTFAVAGSFWTRYAAEGGAAGALGAPAAEELTVDGKRQQFFEGGALVQEAPGAAVAVAVRPRVPVVTATPATVLAGGRVRIALGGFDAGATLRVSLSGQPDFTVTTASGAFIWENVISPASPSRQVRVRAAAATGAAAEGVYNIRSHADSVLRLAKLDGDNQAGAPGALLARRLRVVLRDSAGNPAAGVPIVFEASAGSVIVSASRATDANGEAEAGLRLPPREIVAAATARAAGSVATFYAHAVPTALKDFPRFKMQEVTLPLGNGAALISDRGALLAAAAAILRYHQQRGELPQPNGLADLSILNTYLKSVCTADLNGAQLCDGFLTPPDSDEQIVNLWRLAGFTGGLTDPSPEKPDLDTVRDLVAAGFPALVALDLNRDGAAAGAHFVVATGVAGNGAILIYDPAGYFGVENLNTLLDGFTAGSSVWRGRLAAVVRLLPRPPRAGFLVTSPNAFDVASDQGSCGAGAVWPALSAVLTGAPPAAPPGLFHMRPCAAAQTNYELDVQDTGSHTVTLTDLGSPANRVTASGQGMASYLVARNQAWSLYPQTPQFAAANAFLNAASFTPGLAPGGLLSIFGIGLAGAAPARVEIGGLAAEVLASSAFRVTVRIPPALSAGRYALRLSSQFGVASAEIELRATAPAITLLDGVRRGAVVNPDGEINAPEHAVARGQYVTVYGTGFAAGPVQAEIDGQPAPVLYAGAAAGFPGLYQINVAIPAALPPGIGQSLVLKQAGVASNPVSLAVE